MTEKKLRHLDPQPQDLMVHNGPFVNGKGQVARILATDLVDSKGHNMVWAYLAKEKDEFIASTNNGGFASGAQIIFAAEEIPEPRVRWLVFFPSGTIYTSCTDREAAKREAKRIDGDGTYAKFVEVLETED